MSERKKLSRPRAPVPAICIARQDVFAQEPGESSRTRRAKDWAIREKKHNPKTSADRFLAYALGRSRNLGRSLLHAHSSSLPHNFFSEALFFLFFLTFFFLSSLFLSSSFSSSFPVLLSSTSPPFPLKTSPGRGNSRLWPRFKPSSTAASG